MPDIVATKLTKSYGERLLFQGLSFRLPQGTCSLLTGPSGRGKTTIARILLGLEAPDTGEVVRGEACRMAALFQEHRLIDSLSSFSNLSLATGAPAKGILRALEEAGLSHSADQRVESLSGGQKRRISLLRALLAPADFVILDEPFREMDQASADRMRALVVQYLRGKTSLLISHDPKDLALCTGIRMDFSETEIRVFQELGRKGDFS